MTNIISCLTNCSKIFQAFKLEGENIKTISVTTAIERRFLSNQETVILAGKKLEAFFRLARQFAVPKDTPVLEWFQESQ